MLSAAIAVCIHFKLEEVHEELRNQVRFLNGQIRKLELETAEISGLRPAIGQLLGRKNVIEALQEHRLKYVGLLDEIARLRPEGIALESIKVEQSEVVIEGSASSEEAVNKFIANFPASYRFARPQDVVAEHSNGDLAVKFSFKTALRAVTEKGQ